MRLLGLVALAVCVLCLLASPASAVVVSFYYTIHNATGQDANDFHIGGQLGVHPDFPAPTQTALVLSPADWEETGQSIVKDGREIRDGEIADLYDVNIDFEGDTPIPHCESLKLVKEFSAEGNIWIDLHGYWTKDGFKIAGQPDIPLIGFWVNDIKGNVMLQNATGIDIAMSGFELAVSSTLVSMEDRAHPYSGTMAAMSWTAVPGLTSISAGQEVTYNLGNLGITLGPNQYLYSRYGVWDQPLGTYLENGWVHQSTPEPGCLALLGIGAILVVYGRHRAVWRRK